MHNVSRFIEMNDGGADSGAALGRELSYEVVRLHEAIGARLGLSATDHKYLDLIDRQAPVTPGRVGELTGLTSAAVTALIDRLEGQGYVRRTPDASDRRRVRVDVVPDRIAAIGELMAPMGHHLAPVFAGMDDREVAAVRRFIDGLIDAVRRTRHGIEGEGGPSADPDRRPG